MKDKILIDSTINAFYTKISEESRLAKGTGAFEFERTKNLIQRYLPATPKNIIDVGGGTGKYAHWLANMGHHVHLVEPVAKHIKQANKRAQSIGNPFFVHHGEAKNLPFSNQFADAIIAHGPLYHLQQQQDRLDAIKEAKRTLRPGGLLLAFAINRTSSTLVGLMQGLMHEKGFLEMCLNEIEDGIHLPPANIPGLFTKAFFHEPQQLEKELMAQDFHIEDIIAVEGMTWLDKDFFISLAVHDRKKTLLKFLQRTERNRYLLPFSPHFMVVASNK
ncbi:MAG: class I SAM-dependent methyltransferase [Bacteroidota bacterium]